MSGALIAAAIWAIAATLTALLPIRRQFTPGLILLVFAPLLILWIAVDINIWVALAGVAGVFSMFRNPLIYFWRRWTGGDK